MRERLLILYVWESGAFAARALRLVLRPVAALFAFVVALRNLAYDRGWLAAVSGGLPTIGVGNLTVGGTGKTPLAAWLVARLRDAGARPALVMRGYGSDEALVHRRLNPGIPVIADADRVRGARFARSEGATVAVLDDGFQHRRAHRDADVVLLSADRFGPVRLLPAGPWREPLTALARATMVVVTRKTASRVRARELLQHALRFAPSASGAIVHLAADGLVSAADGTMLALDALAGTSVLAISAIGDTRAFESQLRSTGAVVTGAAFPDHHAFSAAEVQALAYRTAEFRFAVCTLKDVVKLTPAWPREAPAIWYLSQRVIVEAGAEALDALVADFAARGAHLPKTDTQPPETSGPTTDSHVS
jgi:tetraacyldisaccharide 4'-kinase